MLKNTSTPNQRKVNLALPQGFDSEFLCTEGTCEEKIINNRTYTVCKVRYVLAFEKIVECLNYYRVLAREILEVPCIQMMRSKDKH